MQIKMLLTLVFDRNIDTTKYYISPELYSLQFSNGDIVCFDFLDQCGYIDKDNPNTVTFECTNLDLESFGDTFAQNNQFKPAKYLEKMLKTDKVVGVDKIMISTGFHEVDEDADEINLKSIACMVFRLSDGSIVPIENSLLEDACKWAIKS